MRIRHHDAVTFAETRLAEMERKHGMTTEEFYAGFRAGKRMVEDWYEAGYWASLYEGLQRWRPRGRSGKLDIALRGSRLA